MRVRQRRMKLVSSGFETTPPPWIEHGERGDGLDPEDTLPLPRCLQCRGEIYYMPSGWKHQDHTDHEAVPEVARLSRRRRTDGLCGKGLHEMTPENSYRVNCKQCKADRQRASKA